MDYRSDSVLLLAIAFPLTCVSAVSADDLPTVQLHGFGSNNQLTITENCGGIQWNEQEVIDDLSGPPNNWTEAQIRHNVLNKYAADQIHGTEFDKESVMLYSFPPEWTQDGFHHPRNDDLSEMDKLFVASEKMYPRIATPAIVHWPAGLKRKKGSIVREPAHLIDVMPTLADVTQCEIPSTWPEREVRPVSGVSLRPIFDGQSLGPRPPIHLLFSNDRGLREGDWKAVSFRQEAWELYNMVEDRTELQNLADAEPQRLKAMIQKWTDMTRDVLHGPRQSFVPAKPAKLPHRHPEWTNFDGRSAPQAAAGKGTRKKRTGRIGIRARKNTQLTIADGKLILLFTGDDPGIAMDLRARQLPPARLWPVCG